MYKELKIDQIKSNPNNPRTIFEGQKFDDLMKSIKEKGVLEPILVRPVNGKFEIVAGERRFRALQQIVGEPGYEGVVVTIPSITRKINDDEAFEIMIIENLQREDLMPLEEIQSFEKYVKKHGKEGVDALGERTGIRPAYIRRRIAALRLPKRALDAWNKGVLTFGHLEELIRLKDKQDLREMLHKLLDSGWRDMTVKDLRDHINARIPLLTKAKFDKTECNSCMQNSDVQKKLWDTEPMKKTHCLNPKCFLKKQVGYLTKNWPQTSWAKRFKTTGFAFDHDLSWNDRNFFSYIKPFKKCLEGCENFLTVIKLDGTLEAGQACVKNDKCFQSLSRLRLQKGTKKEKKDDGGPRVHWHGQYFREEFFKVSIPAKFKNYEPSSIKIARLTLFSILRLNRDLLDWFARKAKLIKEGGDTWDLEEGDIIYSILGMELPEVAELTKEATLQIVLQQNTVVPSDRMRAAEHLGIDLSKEWAMTEEYLQKKTIKEMLQFGKKLGVFDDVKAKAFLVKTLKKKPMKYDKCKKTELLDVFLKSGVELVGKVPDEIIPKKEKE